MNGIFMLSFLFTLAVSLIIDRRMLKQEKNAVKMTYGLITFLIVGLFISKHLHWNIPMPSRFFIHTVSPWLVRVLGIK
ncbi:hypothetical protein QFZ80_007692 [Paenibacillus sp. V4I7]|uniref:hypothetical protein n=1 Tax=Paenibacillus sp. V4I5 TaxID=3042306 RepID=UPI0027858625|nr:hypothetical protein [Paenibacillus sp. V4I5]MDQ0903864.1 hypothetical protein [Paenibacillus sp. V4I7]MDQ0917662.1 hypothetical protein [Paenibacillus sp. V4I5]